MRLRARLEDLRAQEAELSPSTPHEPGRGPTPADLAAIADQLERVIAERRAAEDEGAPPLLIPGATRRGTSADPAHLEARYARGFRNVRKSGAYRDRTGDLRLAKPSCALQGCAGEGEDYRPEQAFCWLACGKARSFRDVPARSRGMSAV